MIRVTYLLRNRRFYFSVGDSTTDALNHTELALRYGLDEPTQLECFNEAIVSGDVYNVDQLTNDFAITVKSVVLDFANSQYMDASGNWKEFRIVNDKIEDETSHFNGWWRDLPVSWIYWFSKSFAPYYKQNWPWLNFLLLDPTLQGNVNFVGCWYD